MADLSFIYDKEKGFSDIGISGGDFLLGNDLETAICMSLFTDRRAKDEELAEIQTGITERQSRRGYWANAYRRFEQGSGLWLLSRAKRQEIVRVRAESDALKSLEWLKREGIAQDVAVSASFVGASGLDIKVSVSKPSGEELNYKYQFVWG